MTRLPLFRLRPSRASLCLAGVAVSLCLASDGYAGEARTRVLLNGVPTPVVFNDGDSFRVLGGPMTGAKSRLSGFNTLESHGPVHQWGTWTEKEMFVLAKMAMYHGRTGVWHCTSDGKTDTYGRMLTWCPDLAESLVRAGLAHVMSVDDSPGKPELIEAQREAQAARRGLWAHGVPPFVLTSLHSIEEDTEDRGVYNRLVSTVDGHSVKWKHEVKYEECARVCHMVYAVDETKCDEVAARLQREQAALIAGLDEAGLKKVVREFARHHHVTIPVPGAQQEKLQAVLLDWAAKGAFGAQQEREEACMIHVDFKRRYGGARAQCLR